MSFLVNPYAIGVTAVTDPLFSNVVLLCHFDGTNGATAFIDSSLANHSVTGSAGSQLTTAQAKYGVSSLQASATTGSASSADSADWDFGGGQFTVEAWVRPTTAPSGLRALVTQWSSSLGQFAWWFGWNGNGIEMHWSTSGSNNLTLFGAYTPTLNSWVHVAADRDASNVIRLYAGGTVLNSVTAAVTLFNSTEPLRIGNDGAGNRAFLGQIDDVRVTKGAARYAGAFTPPIAAFPDS